jgi:NAD(P) transhydrogenase subunit alpha
MKIGILRETFPGERRVALVPSSLPPLTKSGFQIVVESRAGESAGFPDRAYQEKGAQIVARPEAAAADLVATVRNAGANIQAAEPIPTRSGQVQIGLCDPLSEPKAVAAIAPSGITLFALEMIPRITRAQSMDVLSSQATVAGYRAVLLAAKHLPRMFPMLMTAAGTITAARVLVIGAGVAGLQAIAIARKLGAVVHAYDVRPACREQVESLGGKFVELPIENAAAEDKGGYARAMDESFYRRQRELLGDVVATNDVAISTALVPGRKSPLLITADAVRRMAPGSVVVDLAAERGGNCELSKPDQVVVENGVTILGPTNLASGNPYHASLMFSNNLTKFLQNLAPKGELVINLEDEIIRDTLLTQQGQIVHSRIRDLLNPPAPTSTVSQTS